MRKFILSLLGISLVWASYSQGTLGKWRDYLSYSNAIKVAASDSKIYCATEGGLFYFDTEDNSLNKINNLSDFGIQTIAYSTENNLLLVAYTNSNLDILKDGEVINLSDIKRKTITADKTIHNITFRGSDAYLSCGFGIVAVNLEKAEIKDTYFIGDDGGQVAVYDVDFFQGMIYAATEKGMLKAPESGANLLDYTSWMEENAVPHAGGKFIQLEVHAGQLIACYSPDSGGDESFRFDGNTWSDYYSGMSEVLEMRADGNYLSFTGKQEVVLLDAGNVIVGKINRYQLYGGTVSSISSNSTVVAADGEIWIADNSRALIRYDGDRFESLMPNGPVDNSVFSLTANKSDLWVTAGGRTDVWNNSWIAPRFQLLRAGEWTNFSTSEIPGFDGFNDIVCLAVDPNDPNHIFAGSWGGGLLEIRDGQLVARYTNKNSPLQSALPQQPDEPYVRIGGIDFDSQGNLWICTWAVSGNNLHSLSPDGEWESFSMSQALGKATGQLLVNANDDKWILVPRNNNAYVVDKTGDHKYRLAVTSYFSNSKDEYLTEMSDVYSIAEDQDGAIWIGTSVGVAVYSNPYRIWSTSPFYASQPGLDLNDGIYHPLLSTETVTAIAVDGANRKWLGTKSSGVFLVSESGESEVEHFTAENSPLLSNNIKSIAINDKTGEVFFGTDKGLISYQSDASGGNNDYSDVYVYPNPVRETYDGPVTVAGLMADTDVKITDIAGNLVFKTTSQGGQAIWDGKNLNGNRVKTGVYLVFCNDKYGNETHITKLLFIH
ncbi:two-component regulator propeller domain-containing protein [Maribellus sp. YY47]|uniref:type IX secretion system anionic LPS delivery protein PorZ n=1 Tax=Maribellus sp. YY47 TaxID=2929486 RepID=UPI0020014472|nr:two-component regulator propeller domain-containing protein [Maribellus sp. YY47]MCK3685964.1 T9SS type A sorting domain-containing protein [Maribellus sp. YY47]